MLTLWLATGVVAKEAVGGAGVLRGAASYAFTATGALQTETRVVAATTLTFSTAGTLAGAGAAAALSGASTLTFAGAAAIRGDTSASGATAFAFSTTGAAITGAALFGVSPVAFTVSGTLSGAGADGAMSGASTLTFITSGGLTGVAGVQIGGGGYMPRTVRRPVRRREIDWDEVQRRIAALKAPRVQAIAKQQDTPAATRAVVSPLLGMVEEAKASGAPEVARAVALLGDLAPEQWPMQADTILALIEAHKRRKRRQNEDALHLLLEAA